MEINEINYNRKLWPLLLTQSLGVFNDNAFKAVLVFTAIGLSSDYGTNSFFIALMTVVFVLPFIMFAVPAGFITDRFYKKNVLIFSKVLEIAAMALGAVLLYFLEWVGIFPLVIVLFLMASQSSFFSPAFNSILPEQFGEKEISKANGIIGMFVFIAVILGYSVGIFLKFLTGGSIYIAGIVFTIIAVVGFFITLKVINSGSPDKSRTLKSNFFSEFLNNLKLIYRRRSVFVSALGEAYFYAIGSSIQSVVILYGKFSLELNNDLELGFLQVILAIGMAIGCFYGGRLSRNKLELGISLWGCLGLIAFLLLMVLFPGEGINFNLGATPLTIFPSFTGLLFLASLFSGIFVIPLRVCQQERSSFNERGRILASSNLFTFTGILFAGLFTYILTGKVDPAAKSSPEMLLFINNLILSLDPSTVIIIIALLTTIVAVAMFVFHKEFLYRAVIVLLTRTVYKVDNHGIQNIPSTGGGLLISNHVSVLDNIFISSCSSRVINFMISKDTRNVFFRKLYRFCCGINNYKIHDLDDPEIQEKIKSLLKKGELVCIYPEGEMTKNGILGNFQIDIKKLLPPDKDVPVLPVYVGSVWGSIFSRYFKEFSKIPFPSQFPHYVRINFGEPINPDSSAFQLRQIISELEADTHTPHKPNEKTLHHHFLKLTKSQPFKKLMADYNDKGISCLKLLLSSLLLSKEIKRYKEEKYIGILLPNSTATAISILSVLYADKTPAILNFTVPKESIEDSLEKGEITRVITSKRFVNKLNLSFSDSIEMIYLEDIKEKTSIKNKIKIFSQILFIPTYFLIKIYSPHTFKDVYNTAILLFSSGSTAKPKGIKLSHHNLNSNVSFSLGVVGRKMNDKITGNLPLFHSFGLSVCFWAPLLLKFKVIYIKNPIDTNSIINAIKKHQLTILTSTPTFIRAYLKKIKPNDFSSLRLVIVGAEKLQDSLAKKFKDHTGLELIEGYGCTELSPIAAINVSDNIKDIGKEPGRKGSIGRAIPGVCAKVCSHDSFEELTPNTNGILFIKGPNVMKGYLDKKHTEKVIHKNWYNTGDIARMNEEGFIFITGRASRFSKIGGEMISHEFVEMKIHEALNLENKVLAVTGVSDKKKGEKLVVFHEYELDAEKIIAKLKQEGVPNLAIPKAENFIQIKKLPVMQTGKLDVKKLEELASSYSGNI